MDAFYGSSTGPKWSSDGKELFYISLDWRLMSVPVRLGSTFDMGTPHPLFTLPEDSEYEPSADPQRFLVLATDQSQAPAPITVVLNWTAELNRPK